MAARPPGGGGGSSEPEAIEFGIAALDARLDEADVSFPATGEEILRALDDHTVPYDSKGRTLELDAVLERVPQSEFDNETAFLDAVYPAFDEARRESGSFLDRLRDALPF
ncbi:hypothetical protein GRS48_08975 [Halorubrum sp. JWXQ-INN 858]|uniref:DUF5789 family protein n=1 Tax=Halorubrum sp. JWXQ-INN 858 TaxID=2690782 RepID=UPI00135B4C75|nr:hypothetical protein [Halorubrum sp. JWXQ-INN 858]MWV64948.1 hypothetical protein [Halorubrum sp. JWXQ-INN 858]